MKIIIESETPINITNPNKKYFHELTQEEIDQLIEEKRTIGYILENFKQPKWCDYPEALNGQMGCWTLTDLGETNLRTKISEEYCKSCDCFKK